MASKSDNVIPKWKRDLIERRKCQSKTIGIGSVQQQLSGSGATSAGTGTASEGTSEGSAGGVVGLLDFQPGITGYVNANHNQSNGACSSKSNGEAASEHSDCPGELSDLSVSDSADASTPGDTIVRCTVTSVVTMVEDRMPSATPHNGDGDSDSSEELQYGPGIVNKLKCKYLSLTLREASKSRPSILTLRRATSLDNLLDEMETLSDAGNITPVDAARKFQPRTPNAPQVTAKNRYRNLSRGNKDSMKRARSVEALMRYSSISNATGNDDNASSIESFNEDVVIVEEGSVTDRDNLQLVQTDFIQIVTTSHKETRVNRPKRLTSFMDETERPPPDVVKTTMRIFEKSPGRKMKPPKPTGDVAAKVATYKPKTNRGDKQPKPKVAINTNVKPAISPKPFMSPEKVKRSPGISPKNTNNFNFNTKLSPPNSPKKIISQFEKEISQEKERSLSPISKKIVTEPIGKRTPSPVFVRIDNDTTVTVNGTSKPEPESSRLKSGPESPRLKPEPESSRLKPRPESPRLKPGPESPRIANNTCPPSPTSVKLLAEHFIKQEIIEISVCLSPEPVKILPNLVSDSPVTQITKQISKLTIASPLLTKTNEPNTQRAESEDEGDNSNAEQTKNVTKNALDNIGKAGMTIHFNFNNNASHSKSHLPVAPPRTEQNGVSKTATKPDVSKTFEPHIKQVGTKPDVSKTFEPHIKQVGTKPDIPKTFEPHIKQVGTKPDVPKTFEPHIKQVGTKPDVPKTFEPLVKQAGVIRNTSLTKHTQSTVKSAPLTSREIEKNLINKNKSIGLEQPVSKVVVSVLNNASEASCVSNNKNAADKGLTHWEGFNKGWHQQTNNTMVFNFSARKDVPDYIENDGIILRSKREKPRVGDSGFILLGHSGTQESSDFDDEVEGPDWNTGPPSPCDVDFENDNVIINGKSNLASPSPGRAKSHKLHIHFDDGLTSTFEYPSEASLLEESGGVTVTPGSLTSASLGTTPLASYTPIKVGISGFELGVTRTAPEIPIRTTPALPTLNGTTQRSEDPDSLQYLKPATDEQTIPWSQEKTATDLLF